MFYQKDKRGMYILRAMENISLNGDAYTTEDELYKVCHRDNRYLTYSAFREDMYHLLKEKCLYLEGRRLYTNYNWRCEQSAAASLANILRAPNLDRPELPNRLTVNGVQLTVEQCSAVTLALSSRLSLILGGAGTGKTTLIQAIVAHCPSPSGCVLCAPTGKAARNLTNRTGFEARTVHSALGLRPDDDFLEPVQWPYVSLLAVDEASMMTSEMLAGILQRVPKTCRIVLVGDPYQLLSVGAGNVLPDLLALGVPNVTLKTTHRQSKDAVGLVHNTMQFSSLSRASDLVFDDSFQLVQLAEKDIQAAIRDEAVKRYLAGESVQVLSPFNKATDLSVQSLNQAIQPLVNPPFEDKHSLKLEKGPVFWDSDRVMVTKNDRERRCCNGDVGVLRIRSQPYETPDYSVVLPDERRPTWDDTSGLCHMCTAYAITVHKSQGSEYDTVLMPVSKRMQSMMVRNLLYTAITRAKREVMLFGDLNALDSAMQRVPRQRKSMLVPKTQMALWNAAKMTNLVIFATQEREVKMDYEKIGKRIRDLRRQQGYTQEALAEAVDLSAPFVSHIERASKKASLETISRIAAALNVTVDYLLTGTRSVDAAAFLPEVEMLLRNCLPYEKQIIVDVAEATKKSLIDNRQAA